MNPILERELLSLFRTRRAFAVQVGVAVVCTLLIALRWPDGAQVDLAGIRSREVFILFGYALLASVVLLVPSFPAVSIVRERQQRTLVLLLNSPLTASKIYFGKLAATPQLCDGLNQVCIAHTCTHQHVLSEPCVCA